MNNIIDRVTYKRKDWVILFSITLIGLLLRLYRLNAQSLWYDEAFSVWVSTKSLADMIHPIVQVSWNHPPLHYFLLHVWLKLLGTGDLQARLLSVIFGTLSIVMLYILAKLLFDSKTGLIAALLMTISQLGVMYSQEARPYTQLLFLAICSLYFFIKALREKNIGAWWIFVIVSILLLYTNFYSIFILLSLFLYAVIYRRKYSIPISWVIFGVILTIVIFIPWFTTGVIEKALNISELTGSQPFWFAVNPRSFVSAINSFNNGKVQGLFNASTWWAYILGGILFTLPLLFVWFYKENKPDSVYRENLIYLVLVCFIPLSLIIGISYVFGIQYDVRYVLFCTIPYYVLIARGLSGIKPSVLQATIIAFILFYSIFSLRANYFIPYKENYRDALTYLVSEQVAGDCTVFSPFGKIPLEYYIYIGNDKELRVIDLGDDIKNNNCDRLWFVAYRRVGWAIEENNKWESILESTMVKNYEKEYFWINVSLYVSPTK